MWRVVVIFMDGTYEIDKAFDDRFEAEIRCGQAGRYYAQFGGVAMVLTSKMAGFFAKKKLKRY